MSSTTLLSRAPPEETPHPADRKHEVTVTDDGGTASTRHPLGLKPAGNALTYHGSEDAHSHMGDFSRLPDALLLTALEFLEGRSLVALGSSCRALYAYCTYDILWKDLAIKALRPDFGWRGSWRASIRRLPTADLAHIDCSSLFSDALYRPFLCSQIPLEPYSSNIPQRNAIPRLEDISPAEFDSLWVDRPFILTRPVKTWQVYATFDQQKLLADYGKIPFRCEALDLTLETYLEYMNNTQDESPLYLFDRRFVEKMELAGTETVAAPSAYEIPAAFREDLFTLLGDQRPDHRWLIVGPAGSGSSYHKDPNATSAWNAVIRGLKYWIMFPNSILPPGVYMSEDQSEVTSPLSIAEWLLSFHSEARATYGCMEGICRQGEVLHVPSGWWHLVVNLEPAIAITQNFVPRAHAHTTLRFLQDKAGQVSGFRDDVTDAYGLFVERLREAYPGLVASLGDRKRKWEEVVRNGGDDGGDRQGFSFGFGEDVDEDEVQ